MLVKELVMARPRSWVAGGKRQQAAGLGVSWARRARVPSGLQVTATWRTRPSRRRSASSNAAFPSGLSPDRAKETRLPPPPNGMGRPGLEPTPNLLGCHQNTPAFDQESTYI